MWKWKCYSLDCVWLFATPWTTRSPPGSSVYGILQARILEWVAIPFFRGSSWPRGQTWVSCIVRILYHLSHQGGYTPIQSKKLEKNFKQNTPFVFKQSISVNAQLFSIYLLPSQRWDLVGERDICLCGPGEDLWTNMLSQWFGLVSRSPALLTLRCSWWIAVYFPLLPLSLCLLCYVPWLLPQHGCSSPWSTCFWHFASWPCEVPWGSQRSYLPSSLPRMQRPRGPFQTEGGAGPREAQERQFGQLLCLTVLIHQPNWCNCCTLRGLVGPRGTLQSLQALESSILKFGR